MDKKTTTLGQFLISLSLVKFIETFLYLWDDAEGEFAPWVLWPKQHEICHILDGGANMLDWFKMIFWPKARQVGGSQIAAALAVKAALESERSEIVIISKTEGDAKYFFQKRIKPLLDSLPGKGIIAGIEGIDWGTWTTGKFGAEFSNGSTIECIATSDDAGRGRTGRLIIMDEAGAMQHASMIWKSASPAVEKNPRGQIVVISNSKAGSWFNNMLKKIDEGKVREIALHFMNLWTDPARDEKWAATRRTQFDNQVDFRVEYPETIKEMFLKKEGYVYPTFDAQEGGRHVYDFDNNWRYRLMYGYDHGFDHFAVFIFALYDHYSDKLYVFDEIYASQKDTYEVSLLINERIKFWQDRGMPLQAWKRIADSAIFADRGQKTVADLMRAYTKLNFLKSLKHDEEGSTNLLRGRFTRSEIVFHPRCFELIRQTRDLMFDKNGKAIDRDNDGPDVLRYLCAELKQEIKPEEKVPNRFYNKDGNKSKGMGLFFGGKDEGQKVKASPNSWMYY